MKFLLLFLEDCYTDVREIEDYYENSSPDLAKQFLISIKDKLSEIEKNPLHFQLRYRNIRIALLAQF